MRVFAACRLDPHTAAELDRTLAPLRVGHSGKRFRWVPAENYHLTLRFFGDVSAQAAADIGVLVESVARTEGAFDCRVNALAPLPNVRRPNVVALPIESGGRLERLADNLNGTFSARFGGPDRPFRAHLTVLRCRPGPRLRITDAPIAFLFTVTSVGLYESMQVAGGVRYTAVCEFELGHADDA